MLEEYLKTLGSTKGGNIIVHNILGTLKSGRATKNDVKPLLEQAAVLWKTGTPKSWGAACSASCALYDAIVADPARWRFRGRLAKDTNYKVSFVVTLDRLLDGDIVPVDKVKLHAAGFGRGLVPTPLLTDAIAAKINAGALLDPAGNLGHRYGIFWATRARNVSRLDRKREGIARLIERCGLYHFPGHPAILMRVTSRKRLGSLMKGISAKAVVPTFVEALNNLRFLGRDLGKDQRWGTALDMRCFRISIDQATEQDLVGAPEVALPAMPFNDNFSVSRIGQITAFMNGSDQHYSDLLDRLFGQDPHKELGAKLV